jgi:hypothetical protein
LNLAIGDAAPASDLLDVFNAYDGGVVFRGLAQGVGGQPAVLGTIGWIFTGFGALFVLWGFVLRARNTGGEGKTGEIAKTWIVIAFMVAGPFLMRTAMECADSLYESSPGGPRNLTAACVKAAYAMPELNALFDLLRKEALAQGGASADPANQRRAALIQSANDGSVLGYLEALGVAVWDTASEEASGAAQTWNGMVRMAAMATGFGSAMLKCLLIAVTVVPLYLLLLASSAIVWFMVQLRFFFAVSGTMMLPLFTGMFSLPAGHPNRQAAQSYVMHMVSLALWPVAWAIGHTGTIALYNALISLIAGTSRVPEIASILQWTSITSSAPTEAQLRVIEQLVHGKHRRAPVHPRRRNRLRALGRGGIRPRPRLPAQAAGDRGTLCHAGRGHRWPAGGRRRPPRAERGTGCRNGGSLQSPPSGRRRGRAALGRPCRRGDAPVRAWARRSGRRAPRRARQHGGRCQAGRPGRLTPALRPPAEPIPRAPVMRSDSKRHDRPH